MPTDIHEQPHTGTIGLFDDDDEDDAATARAERHERGRLASFMRRQERYERCQSRKNHKAADRIAQGKPKMPWPTSWLARVFGGGNDACLGIEGIVREQAGTGATGKDADGKRVEREKIEYVIVRRPSTPELACTVDDVDALESPWLQECGMVRVRSDNCGGAVFGRIVEVWLSHWVLPSCIECWN